MGRGPGSTQRVILATLEATQDPCLTVPELAKHTGRSPRQVRTAVHALQARGLVAITRGVTGWKGRGDYGRWVRARENRWPEEWLPADDPGDPRVATIQPGGPVPPKPGWRVSEDARRPARFIRAGVPVSGLQVWLPDRKAAADEAARRAAQAIAARLTGNL